MKIKPKAKSTRKKQVTSTADITPSDNSSADQGVAILGSAAPSATATLGKFNADAVHPPGS